DYWCRNDGTRYIKVTSSQNLSSFDSIDYKWYKNGLLFGGTGLFPPDEMDINLNNNTFFNSHDTIVCKATCFATCGNVTTYSNGVVLPVISDAAHPQVNISVPSTTICAGDSVAFTAIPTDGGSSPTYFWVIDNFGNCNCNFISSPSGSQTLS